MPGSRLTRIRKKMRAFFTNWDEGAFDVQYVMGNMKLLYGLQPHQLISATFKGKLFLVKRDSLVTSLQRFLFLRRSIRFTFIAFYYDLTLPFEKKERFFLMKKKSCAGRTLIEKLSRQERLSKTALVELTKTVDLFERRGWLQDRILKRVRVWTSRHQQKALVRLARRALQQRIYPILMLSGQSGSYILRDICCEPMALFKPFDEEIGAPHNPSGILWRGPLGRRVIRRGVLVGECIHREVAAFIIDRYLGFHLVPKTYYAAFPDRGFSHLIKEEVAGGIPHAFQGIKRGSLQTYIHKAHSLSKLGQEKVKEISADLFHPLYLLDMIIGHLDRHLSNILYDGTHLFAIDNGFSFPDWNHTFAEWHWKELPQAVVPFRAELLQKIEEISWKEVTSLLKNHTGLSLDAIQATEERGLFLQRMLKESLTARQICERFQGNLCD